MQVYGSQAGICHPAVNTIEQKGNSVKNIISLGAGVQSSTMALMAAQGEIKPMPDAAIFVDTQWEPAYVYKWLDWLETQLPFPVHRPTAGDLRPFDNDWKLRKRFYKNIAKHLTADGVILINEVELYKAKVFIGELWDDRPKSPVGQFMDMVEGNGLRVESCYFLREVDGVSIFMMESKI